MNILESSLLLVLCVVLVSCKNYERKDGKLLLNPVELIDLITQEKYKTNVPVAHYRTVKLTDEFVNGLDPEEGATTEQECRDEETLRARKVWSRWSKWGACSVTCGAGAMTRQRACVAGRCARGEREEQRRTCARPPCDTRRPDDLHDSD